jgi:hypothetical protein
MDEWMKSGRYLPDFMRDFHDQKDVFKTVDETAQRSIENGNNYIKDMSWVAAQVYTVDIFLWVMARHGYTLQRSRKRFAFYDIRSTVGDAMARWKAQASKALLDFMSPTPPAN